MSNLYLIVEIAGQRVALPADHVESVVEIEAVTPVPLVAKHIAGLSALRSRVLTIIDCLAALDLGRTNLSPPLQAVVVTADGHLYGLLVDRVDDVVDAVGTPARLRAPLDRRWAGAARGTVDIAGDVLLLIDPAALIAGPAALAA